MVVDETFDICRGEILQMAESGNERVSSGEVGKLWGGSEVLVIQEVTGTLSPGSHAGSYNGQDAYNDMLITDELRITEDRRIQEERPGEFLEAERLQGFNGSDSTGGEHEKSKKTDTRRV